MPRGIREQLRSLSVEREAARTEEPRRRPALLPFEGSTQGDPSKHFMAVVGLQQAQPRGPRPAQAGRRPNRPLEDVLRIGQEVLGKAVQKFVF
jgi:hypothetical protein